MARFFLFNLKMHHEMRHRVASGAIMALLLCGGPVFPQSPGSPYKPGEKATYLIHYGVINGGIATLEIREATLDGQQVWHSAMRAQTTGMADAVYKVRDVYESFIDPATELPLKSIRNISEGKYKRYNEVLFDHTTRGDSAILLSDLTGTHITEKGIHDILSCFYWFRKQYMPNAGTFKPGQVITINTWFTDEFYPIRMRYAGTEEIKTKSGRILCHKFNPVTEVGRLFKTQDDMSVWFSADKNYLPVKIRFDIFVGSFSVNLMAYEGLAYPLNIK
ncbi:MAG: DUF3108 domain-containing protein [Bacteroidetes bacterium]|nr:DUF3108 domain-containing protein [Bacteroidota bacterium]